MISCIWVASTIHGTTRYIQRLEYMNLIWGPGTLASWIRRAAAASEAIPPPTRYALVSVLRISRSTPMVIGSRLEVRHDSSCSSNEYLGT
jgi:hypothetical protein